MGRNFARSWSLVVRLKYWVAESCPPVRMALASCTLIFFTESTSSALASGTAASAARLSVRISSSACLPMPNWRMTFSTFCADSGSGIFTLPLPKNPSCLPSASTATWEPFTSASRKPVVASWLVMDSSPARAGQPRARPAIRANMRVFMAISSQ